MLPAINTLCIWCRYSRQCIGAGGGLLAGAYIPDDVPYHRAGHAEGGGAEPASQGLPLLLLPRQAQPE